ncbi:hypothetical protein MTR_0003s0160 [Medicago truncatula]|uniref:Uncharacterized protein n=1 Tax=Medicago truncatula TaxID=3880 RepID=A0A072TLA5_MEDTR|nr:hypothetical protein MTR_0003s0160 [Medicago truncatula]
MSGAEPESSTSTAIPYDYGSNKKYDYGKVPKFNGDPEEFSWWKTNFYKYGIGDLVVDEEGAAIDRRKHTPAQKKFYKKHHTIRGALVKATPKAEYMKMSDKSTAKSMFISLCANYEGSKKV